MIGEGQFSRPIPLASEPGDPLPRLAWSRGPACPGVEGDCASFCTGLPASCPADSCMPLLIDSGSPLSILPDTGSSWSIDNECLEVRAAGGLLDGDTARSTAAFRFLGAPIVRAPGDDAASWLWRAGDDRNTAPVGGVIGGNILRDFATEFRHVYGETPTVAFFSSYPGSEVVLADQGRAYLRLQYPGRLLGRLLNDHCEIGDGVDCALTTFTLNPGNEVLLFESTRPLVDTCVAPPPCAATWNQDKDRCQLSRGDDSLTACSSTDLGASATLLVATGTPGLVLFEDSAEAMFGPLASLPACGGSLPEEARACLEVGVVGFLDLPGWPTLDQLPRIKVRSLAVLEGLAQPTGRAPCARLRRRLQGLDHQCDGFLAEGRPVRPSPDPDESLSDSALILGEVAWRDDQLAADGDRWLDTLIVPATAAPVISLRREVTPEGAQPDGMLGSALLQQTETVLDFTEASTSPGIRVRCLDPGERCTALPACSADVDTVDFEQASAGRTSCCHGLPADLVTQVVLGGEGKPTPRVEDACCAALPQAALGDFKTLGLCTG